MDQQPPVIEFNHVSKRFTFTKERNDSVLASVINMVRRTTPSHHSDLWAVNDVSFTVQHGESVGLIGRNGSGKSTLLKLASRILRPTSGNVKVNGRVGALLELGAGFHEELTGRENIYLNASVFGLSKQEIDDLFDTIVEFSELDNFLEMPVKHYSSGMYMRLGFSVAVHCEPDVLFVDEILAVGDQAFQRKCIDRIFQMKKSGVTIIMVSHHIETLQKLCDSLVWMDQGVMREYGATPDVVAKYVEHMNARIDRQTTLTTKFHRYGTREAEINTVRFLNTDGEPQDHFQTGDAIIIEMAYTAHESIEDPEMGFAIFREDGTHINGPNNRTIGYDIPIIAGEGVLRYCIASFPLLAGTYVVSAAIQDGHRPHAYDFHEKAYTFKIEPGGTPEFHGLIEIPGNWELIAQPVNSLTATQ